MAHRKTAEQAEKLRIKFQQSNPSIKIVVKDHPRGGYLIVEARECEECGEEFTTSAIGEWNPGGDFCRKCEAEVYEERNRKYAAESAKRNAETETQIQAEAWYYAEEPTG